MVICSITAQIPTRKDQPFTHSKKSYLVRILACLSKHSKALPSKKLPPRPRCCEMRCMMLPHRRAPTTIERTLYVCSSRDSSHPFGFHIASPDWSQSRTDRQC